MLYGNLCQWWDTSWCITRKDAGNHLKQLDSSEDFLYLGAFSFIFCFSSSGLFTVSSISDFLFYSILLLFSQVKCINYLSIFSFQSFPFHILLSKVPTSQQGFKTRCSPRGVSIGCTHYKIIYSFPSRVGDGRKANRGGRPLEYYLKAQMVNSGRQQAQSDYSVYQLWSLFCYVWRELEARLDFFVLYLLLLFISLPL